MPHSTRGERVRTKSVSRVRAVGFWLGTISSIALLTAAPTIGAADPIQAARGFLASRQLETGGFTGARVGDVFESVAALPDRATQDAALVALLLSPVDNLEAGFLRASALAPSPYADPGAAAALIGSIRTHELGLAPGSQDADPLVLAAAIRFAASQGSASDVATLVGVLRAIGRTDGSFGFADNDGDVTPTAEIARVLAGPAGTAAPDLLSAARAWLRGAVAGRGSLPAADLALLLLAFGGTDQASTQVLAAELLARQDPAGSFDGGDLRATALAVQALVAAMPDLVLRPALVLGTPTTGQCAARHLMSA